MKPAEHARAVITTNHDTMNPNGLQLSTPTDTTLVLTRTFNAPRQRVWDAMLVPEKMHRWMSPPPGWATTACESDTRVGGALTLGWSNSDGTPAMALHGVFTEVVLHERIVHTETMVMGSGETVGTLVETHAFADTGGVTTMQITQVYPSKAARDAAVASGMNEGMEACYLQLDALLAQGA